MPPSMNRMTDIPGEFISVLQALIILFISTPGIGTCYSKSVQKKEGGDIMSGQILSLLRHGPVGHTHFLCRPGRYAVRACEVSSIGGWRGIMLIGSFGVVGSM